MKKVKREDIMDYVTYNENRGEIREKCVAEKERRRITLGDHLTFLFENTDTIRYQILEMVRAERMVKEESIRHEIETYNSILGDAGELGCTLLIEFVDPKERDVKLRELASLPEHIYLVLTDGSKSRAAFDRGQISDEKVSSVQFLKFKCPSPPIRIGCDHPKMKLEEDIPSARREILTADLKGS